MSKYDYIFIKNKVIMFSNVISKTFHLTNLNLLYIDNKDTISNETLELLKKFFHFIEIASNEQDVLKVFNLYRINLIIIDIEIPSLNGIEVIKDKKDKRRYFCNYFF